MTIKEALLNEHSKAQCMAIKTEVLKNADKMNDLMKCFFSKDERLGQRAAWPVSYIAIEKPNLIYPYLSNMVHVLDKPHHDAVLRNTVRILSNIQIPKDLEGEVYEKCFNFLIQPKLAIAIRVFSMTVCTNIALKYPELKDELINTIKLFYKPDAKPAYISRAKKCLTLLAK